MTCPHCGADVVPGNTFCHRCRKRVVAPSYPSGAGAGLAPPPPAPSGSEAGWSGGAPSRRLRRPWVVTFVAIMNFIGGAVFLGAGGLILFAAVVAAAAPNAREVGAVLAGLGLVCLLAALLWVFAGVGLLKLRPYGRILEVITLVLGLLAVLAGFVASASSGSRLSGLQVLVTVVNTLTDLAAFMYFLQPGAKLLFSGRDPDDFGAGEWGEVRGFVQTGGLGISIVLGTALGFALALASGVEKIMDTTSRLPSRGRRPTIGRLQEAPARGHHPRIAHNPRALAAVSHSSFLTYTT